MAASSLTNRDLRQFTNELGRLKGKVDDLERGSRQSQLNWSSVEGGAIAVYDKEGLERLRLGLQPDGSYTSSSQNNPDPPPIPAAPTLEPGFGTIRVRSSGTATGEVWPKDFSHLRVWMAVEGGLGQLVATITRDPGGVVLGPLDFVPHRVWFTAANASGKESLASEERTATPKQVVGTDILANTIDEIALKDGAVTQVKVAVDAIGPVQLANAAVEESSIATGAIVSRTVAADAIQAVNIAAGAILARNISAEAITSEHIRAGSIVASSLAALSITTDKLAVNAITAAKIVAGAITADKLEAILVLATRIIAGNVIGARMEINEGGLDAFNNNGDRTFDIDSQTGSVRMVGTLESGIDGSIVRISPGDPGHPLQIPGMYLYADNATYPSLIYSTPLGSATGVVPSSLSLISSLSDTATASHIFMRDDRINIALDQLFATGGNPELRPVGGHLHMAGDVAEIVMRNADGNQGLDGGFMQFNRSLTVLGMQKGTSAQGVLGFFETGSFFMEGQFAQSYNGGGRSAVFMDSFAISNPGVGTLNVSYGVTMQDPSRCVLTDATNPGGTAFTSWTTVASATGFTMQWNQAPPLVAHYVSFATAVT